MAPPGRARRGGQVQATSFTKSMLFAFFTLLLFLSPTTLAASAVLGVDLGTEYIKAALVKPGIPLEIVLTKDSKRKESSAVALKPAPGTSANAESTEKFPERFYGGDALALAPRFPGDVYPNLKQLLGAAIPPYGDASVKTFQTRYPALDLRKDDAKASISFQSKSAAKESGLYTVEELLAMELREIKLNAEKMAGGDRLRDVVITIPTFYTAQERSALGVAADLAGLRIVALITDGMAVGLNYATSRTFDDKPETNLVFDMGAGSTTATLLKFQAKKVKDIGRFNKTVQEITVLGSGWDRTLGGEALNDVILNDMVSKFVESSAAKTAGVEASAVLGHGRTMAKLRKESERVRQVLSANTETSASFEGLYDDVDFKYKISRAAFEEKAAAFVDRVGNPIATALVMAGLTIAQVDSVIIHGGASRTPFVQGVLEKVVGSAAKLKSNVNADEAAVFGAAFKGAGLSPSFKVKDIRTRDIASYTAVIDWNMNGKDRSQNIFVPSSLTDNIKAVPFKNQEDFEISMSQLVPTQDSEPIKRALATYRFTNLTASIAELEKKHGCAKENVTTTISMRLDPVAGLPEIAGGTVSCDTTDIEKKGGVVDGVKGLFGFGSKSEQQQPLGGDGESSEEATPDEVNPEKSSNTENADNATDNTADNATDGKSAKKGKAALKKVPKKKVEVINLLVSTGFTDNSQLSASELETLKDRLYNYDRADDSRKAREELFNTLEGYTYKARDLLQDTGFMGASTKDQRGEIETNLGELNDWMHKEGARAGVNLVAQKLKDLQNLLTPIIQRATETKSRPAVVEKVEETLKSAEQFAANMTKELEKAAASLSSAAASASAAATSASAEEEAAAPSSVEASGSETDAPGVRETAQALVAKLLDYTPYTDNDLHTFNTLVEEIRTWLIEKLDEQSKLQPYEQPVLTIDQLAYQKKKIDRSIEDLKRKAATFVPGAKRPSKYKSKARPKTTTSATASNASPEQSAQPAVENDDYRLSATVLSGESSTASAAESTKSHDEL